MNLNSDVQLIWFLWKYSIEFASELRASIGIKKKYIAQEHAAFTRLVRERVLHVIRFITVSLRMTHTTSQTSSRFIGKVNFADQRYLPLKYPTIFTRFQLLQCTIWKINTVHKSSCCFIIFCVHFRTYM